MDFGADGEANTSDDFIKAYTVYPSGQTGVAYSFNHPGADNMWFSEDDVAGEHNLGDVVYFPNGALLEYEGASEGAVLIIPCLRVGADGAPFTADDQPGCSLGYQIAVIDGQGNRGEVITYNNAGTDGLWFTADDRVKNYTLLTYNGTGVGIATVVYNGDGADNIWFNSDDDVQLHTLTKLGDDFKPRYTATYNGRGTDNTWFSADDVVQAWTYYGYDANGNNILVATHTNKGGDAIWFTADDSATAIISLKDENGYVMIDPVDAVQAIAGQVGVAALHSKAAVTGCANRIVPTRIIAWPVGRHIAVATNTLAESRHARQAAVGATGKKQLQSVKRAGGQHHAIGQ